MSVMESIRSRMPLRGKRREEPAQANFGKHQLCTGRLHIDPQGRVPLAGTCQWTVMRHIGGGRFSADLHEGGEICLVLSEGEKGRGFWPVMSFLTAAEAAALAKVLETAVAEDLGPAPAATSPKRPTVDA